MKTKSVILWALVLFILDQIVKVVIDRYFLEVKFDILPSLLYFKPTFNHQYSWVNGLFGFGMGFWAHIVIFSFVAIILVLVYDFKKTILVKGKILSFAFIFGFAGVISALVGTIIWNGCLDYIYLRPFFVFDLKDVYITVFFLPLFFLSSFKNRKHTSSIVLKDIGHHFKNRFISLIKKSNG